MILFSIAVPPTLNVDPADGVTKVRAGTTVVLKCRASGYPAPKIVWRKRFKTWRTPSKGARALRKEEPKPRPKAAKPRPAG